MLSSVDEVARQAVLYFRAGTCAVYLRTRLGALQDRASHEDGSVASATTVHVGPSGGSRVYLEISLKIK